MSFGCSVGDFVTITQLAWTTYHACKSAGGEYQKLSQEVKSLHIALDRLNDEAEKPGSLIRLDIEQNSTKPRRIWRNCGEVLGEVDGLLNKYEGLGMSRKKLRDRLQFSAKDLGDIRSKIASHTNVINVYIGIVGLGSLGRLEQQSHINREELLKMQEKIDKLAAEFRSGKREGSILTTYSNDHKETWKDFRRSLLSSGFTSDSLTRYGPEIKAYLMQLANNGMLDEQACDSDEIQEEAGKEPTTQHFLKPAEVSETPSQPSSERIDQILGAKISETPGQSSSEKNDQISRLVSALPQLEQLVSKISIDTQYPVTESTADQIPSSPNAAKFILPYHDLGPKQGQDLQADTSPPLRANEHAKEDLRTKAVDLTFAFPEPTANQPLSDMNVSSSAVSPLRHHAKGEYRGLGTGLSSPSVERFSPSDSFPNAFTRSTAEPISVPTGAALDENSETSSVRESDTLDSCRPVAEVKPDPMAKPAIKPEFDSKETILDEMPDLFPRRSTSYALLATREPSNSRRMSNARMRKQMKEYAAWRERKQKEKAEAEEMAWLGKTRQETIRRESEKEAGARSEQEKVELSEEEEMAKLRRTRQEDIPSAGRKAHRTRKHFSPREKFGGDVFQLAAEGIHEITEKERTARRERENPKPAEEQEMAKLREEMAKLREEMAKLRRTKQEDIPSAGRKARPSRTNFSPREKFGGDVSQLAAAGIHEITEKERIARRERENPKPAEEQEMPKLMEEMPNLRETKQKDIRRRALAPRKARPSQPHFSPREKFGGDFSQLAAAGIHEITEKERTARRERENPKPAEEQEMPKLMEEMPNLRETKQKDIRRRASAPRKARPSQPHFSPREKFGGDFSQLAAAGIHEITEKKRTARRERENPKPAEEQEMPNLRGTKQKDIPSAGRKVRLTRTHFPPLRKLERRSFN